MADNPHDKFLEHLGKNITPRWPEHSGDEPPALVRIEEELEEEACANCLFGYTEDEEMWFCRRYPGIQPTDPWWWCGEWIDGDDDD